MMNKYKMAVSCGRGMGIVKNTTKTWGDIVKKLSAHVELDNKEKAGFFVGGAFSGEHRVDEDLICRSLLTLDIDKYTGTIDDLEFDLDLMGLGAFVAYSTYSHTSDKPRVRLVLPLSRDVSRDEYRQLSRSFCESYYPSIYDECSYKPNQFMFYPSCAVGGERWALSGEGDAVNVTLSKTSSLSVKNKSTLTASPSPTITHLSPPTGQHG